MIRLATLLFWLAAPAWATQEYILPTLFDVTGVAAGDVLNIRAEPEGGADIIGHLPPEAERVEVVAHDRSGRWGQVNAGERAGWVAMRYLTYRTDVWEDGRLPAGLRCLGTEPFWAFRSEREALVLERPDAPALRTPMAAVLGNGVPRHPLRAVIAEGGGRRLTAALTPQACSDGMSDRAYGLAATLVLEGADGPELLVGCCSVAP